jgi:outer membrane protein
MTLRSENSRKVGAMRAGCAFVRIAARAFAFSALCLATVQVFGQGFGIPFPAAQAPGPASGVMFPSGGNAPGVDMQTAFPPPAPAAIVGESLEDAWRIALRDDQRFEASRWSLFSAESTLAAARAERFPSLDLGSDYYMLSQQPAFNINLPPLPAAELPFVNRDSVGAYGLVKQPLYTFGQISGGINAATASVQASQAQVCRTVLDVKMNVAEIYVMFLRAIRIVHVAESKVVSLTDHNRVVADHFEKGLVSKNDWLAGQVALADARQQLLEAQNGLEFARAAYNRAIGRNLNDPVQLVELADDGTLSDVELLTCRAMQLRPEIAELSAQAIALREQASSVEAKKAPQVGLEGGYIYQQNQYVDPNGVGVIMLGVKWNAFDSGRVGNQANALRDKAESAIRTRKDVESMIRLEVRQKWLDLQTARQRVQVARQATAQADENLRVAQDRYQQQVGTNTEVLDAETLRVQAYTNWYNSTYQAVLAGLRLRRAVGSL